MSIFGENPQEGQFNPDNPMGIQAPDNIAKPGEPVSDGAIGFEGVEEGFVGNEEGQVVDDNIEGRTSQEEVIESIDIDDDFEKKANFLRQKFKDADDFSNSVKELQQKLGRENDELDPNMTQEDVINYYISLEKELGKTSNVDDTRRENQRLQQELQGLRNTVSQLLMQQQYNQPLRDPITGRFVSPNQQTETQGQEVQNQDIDISFDDIDVSEFMKEFYEKGPNAESFKKILKTASEKVAEHKITQLLESQKQEEAKKQQELLQKHNQARVLKTHYDMQVNDIKSRYGEQEFERCQDDMLHIFRKYPMYLNPQLFPNGFEIVFNQARNMANNYQEQQNTMQNQQQYNTAQKMTARIGGSKPGQRFNKELSPEEREKAMLFQPVNRKGIW